VSDRGTFSSATLNTTVLFFFPYNHFCRFVFSSITALDLSP
jgi:hypothetical protein